MIPVSPGYQPANQETENPSQGGDYVPLNSQTREAAVFQPEGHLTHQLPPQVYPQAWNPPPHSLGQALPRPSQLREPTAVDRHENSAKTGCAGCCTSSPPRDQRGAHGESVQVNLTFYIQGCFGPSPPFNGYDMKNIPYQLYNAGVSDSEWLKRVGMLQQVNNMRLGCCNVSCCLDIFLVIFCACKYACKRCAAHIRVWNDALLKWQNDFNNEVLLRQGCFIKTRSNCWVTYNEKGEKQRHIDRWIAIALTPEQSVILRNEPHLTGDIEAGCCGGVNEHECCVHPNG